MIKFKWILLIFAFIIVVILLVNKLKHEKTYKNYVALGDSIAEGYGLNNKSDRYTKLVQNNYKIKNENFIDLSKSGMTAKELSENIKSQDYENAIKKSDLITISIGSNELLSVFTTILENVLIYNPTNNLNTLASVLSKALQSDSSKAAFENAINVYEQSWNKILNHIKSINPDATIVATEFYNPFHDIENLDSTYIEQLNTILHDKSNNEASYYIAPIYEEFNNSSTPLTNININSKTFNQSSFDPHPNKEGHQLIADKIIEALSK